MKEVSDSWERQAQAIDLSIDTTDKEIEVLQAYHGMDLAWIRGHVMAGLFLKSQSWIKAVGSLRV